MSKGGSLFCPDCHGQMVFRAGDVKITHFATKKACSYPYGEPETEEHQHGKLILRITFALCILKLMSIWSFGSMKQIKDLTSSSFIQMGIDGPLSFNARKYPGKNGRKESIV
ncbi:competence protein CoiA family protein [Paenibacillus abyssi]|uniref:competence protein CoiA family protein n=1 Tax=Paenibacillus abyssi TaxID=1340531 RepID=UPI003618637C